jgi:hypothetical protein
MRKILLQFGTSEQSSILSLAKKHNENWTNKMGYEYFTDIGRKCPQRSLVWEKISYIKEMLPKFEDGSLVVWEDSDSINCKEVCFSNALPVGESFGMVQIRGGVAKAELTPWYNTGVIVMKNSPLLRDFFGRVWAREDKNTDEKAVNAELKHHGWTIGGGVKVYSMNYKWNRWNNNDHLCKPEDTVVQSWHGMKIEGKLTAMRQFVK